MSGVKRWLLSLLLCAGAQAAQQEDYIQHADIERRNLNAIDKLTWQIPQAIRKMSDADPGEKFWAHYWDLEQLSGNESVPHAPAMLHEGSTSLLGRLLFARDASCPTNYSPCTSIGHSDSCCPNGQTCIIVQDTGNGPVGCCAAGATCGNTISGCDSSQGYTSCPDSSNKGCCIPGYVCAGNICINANTQTVTASTSTSSTTTPTPVVVSVTTLTVTNVNTSGFTTTATVTVTQSASGTAVAPVRPTTDSSTAAVNPASVTTTSTSDSTSTSTSTTTSPATTTTTTTTVGGYCPTGYYMCSAIYLGGCCQVDRDCHTTSCPPTASTTVINGSPVIVAPSGASSNGPTCATGWYSCPASLGGNCCPNGYSCAQTNCPASATGVAAQNKETPSEAAAHALAWIYILIASSTALGMILL